MNSTTSTNNPVQLEQVIGPGCTALIRWLDTYVPHVVIRTTADITNPTQLAYDAGKRAVVDELVATLKRLQTDGPRHDPSAVRGG